MEKNVGGYDRIARLVAGPILAAVGILSALGVVLAATDTVGYALAGIAILVGLVFLVTGAIQYCPLNSVIGLNTFRGRDVGERGRDSRGRRS